MKASGLLAYPKGEDQLRGTVGWQHGTTSLRSAAPSEVDVFNGLLPAAVFAGHGYLMVAPDYIGIGVPGEPHSYYHAESTSNSIVDMLRASKTVLEENKLEWPRPLLLSGFSQGGHASMTAQRSLEQVPISGLSVRASAPIAGAVDLSGIGLTAALKGESKFSSLYLAWVAWSYARDYGMPLSTLLSEPYLSKADEIFDGIHRGEEIVAALPTMPKELLAPELLNAIETKGDHWFLDKLQENSLLNWTPVAPIRLYYGEQDVDVTPEQALSMEKTSRERGADVTAISVGEVDHEGSILEAVIQLRNWFDELSRQ